MASKKLESFETCFPVKKDCVTSKQGFPEPEKTNGVSINNPVFAIWLKIHGGADIDLEHEKKVELLWKLLCYYFKPQFAVAGDQKGCLGIIRGRNIDWEKFSSTLMHTIRTWRPLWNDAKISSILSRLLFQFSRGEKMGFKLMKPGSVNAIQLIKQPNITSILQKSLPLRHASPRTSGAKWASNWIRVQKPEGLIQQIAEGLCSNALNQSNGDKKGLTKNPSPRTRGCRHKKLGILKSNLRIENSTTPGSKNQQHLERAKRDNPKKQSSKSSSSPKERYITTNKEEKAHKRRLNHRTKKSSKGNHYRDLSQKIQNRKLSHQDTVFKKVEKRFEENTSTYVEVYKECITNLKEENDALKLSLVRPVENTPTRKFYTRR